MIVNFEVKATTYVHVDEETWNDLKARIETEIENPTDADIWKAYKKLQIDDSGIEYYDFSDEFHENMKVDGYTFADAE